MDPVGFWTVHGIFGGMLFLMLAAAFPRFHMFIGGVVFGAFNLAVLMPGVIVCILWFCLPRVLVAYAAGMFYWDTNPVIVSIGWVVAIIGELIEKIRIFS